MRLQIYGQAIKRKIAFLYSNKKIINTFTYDALLFLSKQYGQVFSKKTKYSELYEFLIKQKPGNEDFWSFGEKLWKSWNKSDEIYSTVLHELKEFYDNDTTFNYVENEIDCINDSRNHFILWAREPVKIWSGAEYFHNKPPAMRVCDRGL